MTTVQIPIKPHLRKYVLRKLEVQEPIIRVSTTDKLGLGLFVMGNLCKKIEYELDCMENKTIKVLSTIPQSSDINFELGNEYARIYGAYIMASRIYSINKFIENYFINEMFAFVHSLILHDPTSVVKFALDDFISIYDINDNDIQFDSLYKTFQRYKDEYSYIK